MTTLAAKAWEILSDEIVAGRGESGKIRRGKLRLSKAAVFIVAQATGVFIYLRNLYFIYHKRPSQGLTRPEESEPIQ
ncbi:MAG TPA: hypothetical protein VMW72_09295 [Sedimentisphaerales bacterium]|jgi:hypothetical protein|nr:hypothetical protein [Sedimentisphaerales bacterium]